ncbi:alpha/beta fold hydrolase [Streptomyces sasae]|uniref:alpha/beta fold hydrolase n=1 Tax=Streptomyces sasae TaxID=1266772 RepID=UPI00292F1031|nr:alpha/beta hydrolase [Streptomyces sasae]
MNRRSLYRRTRTPLAVLAATSVGAALLVTAVDPASASTSPGSSASATRSAAAGKPTVVLVHGAWADGSSWNGVITRLRSRGYRVVAPPNPLRGVSSDAAYLADYLKTIQGPVVLVGHSYGGMVITNAALGNTHVKALVYIDAFIPAKGESAGKIAASEPGSGVIVQDPTTVFNLVPFPGASDGDADLYLRPQVVRASFAQDLSAEQQNRIIATQRPLAASAVNQPSGDPAWKTIPSWALIGRQDKIIPAAAQEAAAQVAHAKVTEINSSHLSLVSRPGAVARLITTAARAS